jgi:hypothetical protein
MNALMRACTVSCLVVVQLTGQRPQIGTGTAHARADVSVLNLTSTRAELLVTLAVDPGWHVSWRNPGETGLPTRLMWSLPPGARVLEETWPVPVIEHTPVGATHTLEGRIPWRVTLALDSALSRDRLLRLTMKYGVCKDVCIPEQVAAQAALVAPAGGRLLAIPADLQTRLSGDAGVIPARLLPGNVLCLSRVPALNGTGVSEFVADSGHSVDAAIPMQTPQRGAGVRLTLPSGATLRDGARALFVRGASGTAARLDLRAPAPGCRASR